ncbi:MAG: hypothetical protein P8Y26_09590 [Gemmatimonadales bacterium]
MSRAAIPHAWRRTAFRGAAAAGLVLVSTFGNRAPVVRAQTVDTAPAQTADAEIRRVSRERIEAAMAGQATLGYNLLASTNSTRFETAVLLDIVRSALPEEAEGPLLLQHEDWYEAYRSVTGLEPEDVPEFVALAHEFGQDRIIDFDPARTKIEIKKGFEPDRVVHVKVGWPEEPGTPDRYTFTDTTTSPHLRITNRQRISYWLLDYGNFIVQDHIEGVQARPLGGALGTLFSIVGDGSAKQNRIAISEDGLVVTYATAKKGPFKVQPLTLTYPDGTVETEFPPDRHDLLQLTYRVKLPLEVKYPKEESD